MQYEIVNLTEKVVAGFSAITNNTSPEMSSVIEVYGRSFIPKMDVKG